jgi:hypothetical protein
MQAFTAEPFPAARGIGTVTSLTNIDFGVATSICHLCTSTLYFYNTIAFTKYCTRSL